MSQSDVNKLVRQVGRVDLEDRMPFGHGLTLSEEKFFKAAMRRRGAKTWRHGWPDFLVLIEGLGHIGVEVKSGNDQVRPSQAEMFAALEGTGLKVFIWHPNRPEVLTPWRKFISARSAEKLSRADERRRTRRAWEEAQVRGREAKATSTDHRVRQ